MKTLKSTITLAATIIIGLALYSQPSYAEEFIISLKQGENLISIPLQPQDTKIEAVISSIAGNYTDVWTHNAGDAIDPWKHYNPDYTGYNDLKTIEHGKGYRLFTNKDCVLKVTGTTPSAQTYPLTLHQGWNLIGWPFVYSQTIPEALKGLQFGIDYDQVSRINPLTKEQEDYYNDSITNDFNTFEPGRAYYIYCLKDVTVTLTSPTGRYPIYSNRSATTSYWVDASSYRSLTEAVAAIGTQEKTLLIPNEQRISSNITIPSNIELHFTKGGKLSIPAGVTVTINGTVDAGLFQIFDCQETGKVAFGQGAVKEVYPQWWGAKGDGVTDDTKAIQTAVNSGHCIVFPAGSYKLTDTITISSSLGSQLYGVGGHTGIHYYSTNKPAFLVTSPDKVIIRDFCITNVSGSAAEGQCGIEIHPVTGESPRSIIDDVVFINLYRGINVEGGVMFGISNCYIQGGVHGIQVADVVNPDGGDSYIFGNYITDQTGNGIAYTSSGGLRIINNKIVGSPPDACPAVGINLDLMTDAHTGDFLISGNSIENFAAWGIVLQTHAGATFNNVVITGNQMSATATMAVIATSGDIDRIAITGNVIVNANCTGISIGGDTNNGVITGNVIDGDNQAKSQAISIGAGKNVRVGTNLIYGQTIANVNSWPISTLADSATPSVLSDEKRSEWLTGGTTTITNFTNGIPGQIITIIAKNPVTITNNTNILLNKGISFDMAINDILTLIQKSDGKWYEISRSVNHK